MKKQLFEMWVKVTADKKKASVLGALVLIALVMWGRAAVMGGPAPSKSSASVKGPGTARGDGAKSGAKNAKEGEVREAARSVHLPALTPLSRNLFIPSEEHFPLPSQTETTVRESPKYPVGNDEKLLEQERLRQETLVRTVRDEAARLRLRTTMSGANPIAVIQTPGGGKSGAVVRIGQTVEGFTLLEVHSARVVLEKSGVVVELTVPMP